MVNVKLSNYQVVNRKVMKKEITAGFAVVVMCLLLSAAFVIGWNREERVECLTWQQQATQFKGFYLTHWQAEQCAAHDIVINAPIQ